MTTPAPAAGMINLLNLTAPEAEAALRAFAESQGVGAYRGSQVVRHLWKNPAPTLDAMTDVPAAFRAALGARFTVPRLALAARQKSRDGTEKFLFRLHDGEAIEAVAIPDGDRVTLCISSQAGCALKCAFCATGRMGFARNLEPWEIAGQVREMALVDKAPMRITNIVFMGMGEPLMNWTAVDPALSILNHPMAFGIGARHITVSTVGILPGIVALGERAEQFRLAISIHAPSDALRQELMPINTKYPLSQVIDAAKSFDRRVTFEYVMLGGVNDAEEHATQLARLAKECRAFVNLIPLHPGGTLEFVPSTADRMRAFARALREAGVEVAVRKSRGTDIAAACGQLRVERLGRRSPRGADQDGQVNVA
ncbi:MAG: 23S rRNA (adenine(2503)-C(2))-methyltransferase RlmN [Gemmatimonadaceae bacterium]